MPSAVEFMLGGLPVESVLNFLYFSGFFYFVLRPLYYI
jgi:hypothetical protein